METQPHAVCVEAVLLSCLFQFLHSKFSNFLSLIRNKTLLLLERVLPSQRAKLVNNLETSKFYWEKVKIKLHRCNILDASFTI